jgi:hypothetical protein
MTNQLSTISFSVPAISSINQAAVARVSERMPELAEKTKIFDRNNSQTTISMMTLTMLNGQSPMRLLRQILAEVERRKMALAEAQLSHAKLVNEIKELSEKELGPVEQAELRLKNISLDSMEGKINGSIKDIATLIDAYDSIKATHGIDDWDEKSFEDEEKRHHVRRGFELLYRNLIQGGRAHEATIEYLQQYGVHVQIALAEVTQYINAVNEAIKQGGMVTASNMEDFLDAMADKYKFCADEAAVRLFGKADFTNSDYMMRNVKK